MGTYLISVAIPVYNEAKQIYENINIIHKILTENNINHDMFFLLFSSKFTPPKNVN